MRGVLALLLCLLPLVCHAQRGGYSGGGGYHGGGYSSARSSSSSSGGGSYHYDGPEPAIFGWIVVGCFGGIIYLSVRGNQLVSVLKIIETPPGEAPEEIRRAWVGVKIPLRRAMSAPVTMATVGVVSQNPTETTRGYAVRGSEALAALAAHNPEAARWWYLNANQVAAPNYVLIFPTEVCEKESLNATAAS